MTLQRRYRVNSQILERITAVLFESEVPMQKVNVRRQKMSAILISTAATKSAAGKSKKKAAASVKTAAAKPTTPDLMVPTQSPTSPLDDISDLLDRLPLQACVELTRQLLTSISSLPTGTARPRAVLKTVILFMAEYGSTP